jgi:hypothetical protein
MSCLLYRATVTKSYRASMTENSLAVDGRAPSDSRLPPALDEEPTLVEALTTLRSETPPRRDAIAPPASFDDPEEHTLVDVIRFRPTEPPR